MAQLLFLLYWVLKSFYTGASGGLQIGDFVFCASFAVFAVQNAHKLVKLDGPSELLKKDRLLGLFIAFVAFINVAYWLYYGDTGLLLAVAYFVFNLLNVIEFRWLVHQKNFMRNFVAANFLCILIQVGVYFSGYGRWYDGVRYMGTFNDPNQLAFFVMSRFFILFVIYNHLKSGDRKEKIGVFAAFALTLFLIVQAASTGMLLGTAVFAALWLIYTFAKDKSAKKLFVLVGIFFVGMVVLSVDEVKLFNFSFLEGTSLFERLTEKINEMGGNSGFEGYIIDRNLQAFFEKTYYILWGAGEGAFGRFTDVAKLGELHSTILGLLFYYGIVPFAILFLWIGKNLKHMRGADWCVYMALFIEMLTLINHRQASLWLLFVLPAVLWQKEDVVQKDSKENKVEA